MVWNKGMSILRPYVSREKRGMRGMKIFFYVIRCIQKRESLYHDLESYILFRILLISNSKVIREEILSIVIHKKTKIESVRGSLTFVLILHVHSLETSDTYTDLRQADLKICFYRHQ